MSVSVSSPNRTTLARKRGPLRVNDVVGPEGGDDPTAPSRLAHYGVMIERIQRAVGGGQELDTEAVEEGAWAVVHTPQAIAQLVVHDVGRVGPQGFADAEHLGEGVVQPELRRSSPEEVVVLGELVPDLPALHLQRGTVQRLDAQRFHGDTLAVQQAQQIVVVGDQLASRVARPGVLRQHGGVAVAVRAHDRQVPGGFVQPTGDLSCPGIGGEEAVFVEHHCKALQTVEKHATLDSRSARARWPFLPGRVCLGRDVPPGASACFQI